MSLSSASQARRAARAADAWNDDSREATLRATRRSSNDHTPREAHEMLRVRALFLASQEALAIR